MATATKKKTAARRRAQAAPVRSAHWIDLDPFYSGYAVWKDGDGNVCVGELVYGSPAMPYFGSYEFDFELGELEAAFDELRGRRKKRPGPGDLADEPYGPPAEFGGLRLERRGTHDYVVVAPCSDYADVTAAELRLLIAAIRDLEVTKL